MSAKYKVETTDYGLKLSVLGFISEDEVRAMNQEIEQQGSGLADGFGVVVDMRASRAFSNEVAELMKEQIGICIKTGMSRGSVVLQSAIMTLQARRLITETNLSDRVRFIDASADTEWEKTAIAWADQGVEPPDRATGAA
ncbi:MAG: hypothetical protein PVG07_03740 [Acidobacteriota bacterium]|jgi:hypothetical protein